MQSFKFVLVAALAVFAIQCRAAEYPVSADKVELRLFVTNGAAIAKNLFEAINTGLDKSKPNVDKILNELAPEAKNLLRKTIDEARAKINEENKRITLIFSTLEKALDSLKPIKVCSDKVSPAAKKLALTTEKAIVAIVEGVQTKYKKEIENIKIGTQKVIKKARDLFDTEVPAVVTCLTPGRKDSSACLAKELDKILEGTVSIVAEAVILYQTANDSLAPILPEVIEKALPLLEKTLKDGQVLIKTLGDCVAALK